MFPWEDSMGSGPTILERWPMKLLVPDSMPVYPRHSAIT